MRAKMLFRSNKIQWSIRFLLFITVIGLLFTNSLLAKTAREINVEVEVAIERFHEQVVGAKQLIESSKGILVMPNVFKGAFLIGGEYGEGALRIDGKTVDYYSTASGSIGIQIGGQKKDIILLFMTEEALKQFRAAKGWESGLDGNVAFWKYGAGVREDTTTTKEPIIGFVIDAKGLIADFSFKGAKFTKMDVAE
jgi:lipid-binding SYLF domain-containing protein